MKEETHINAGAERNALSGADLVQFFVIDGSDFHEAGHASSEMKRLLRGLGAPPDAVRRAAICMYEGEINMFIHASGGTAEVRYDGGSITMTLKDNGPGIEHPELALSEGWSTATDEIRDLGFGAGMGLPNMRRNADEFHLESAVGEGTTVIMKVIL